MLKMSCGLVFSPDHSEVLMIQKNRPEWQAGKLNGIGGKFEPGEDALQCMIRETSEETTLKDVNWHEVAILHGNNYQVNFFAGDADIHDINPLTDEKLCVISVPGVFNPNYWFYNDIIPNLRVII